MFSIYIDWNDFHNFGIFVSRMGIKDLSLVGGLLLIVVGLAKAQEDSLKSALNAVDRRQQDLSEYSGYGEDHIHDYGYSLDGPDSLAFLNSDYNSGKIF